MILLIDANNFFASCERVFNPKLMGKPVVVAGGESGCVIARSNEAKALGIPMGAPLFKVQDIIKRYSVEVCYTNFSLYKDLSKRIMSLIKRHFPIVEVNSIDEAFVDFKGFKIEEAKHIYDIILQGIDISTSIGIAKTKTLSKIANHVAKKNALPYFVLDAKNSDHILESFPASDIWGIGKAMTPKLNALHIKTAVDIQDQSMKNSLNNFSSSYEKSLRHEANAHKSFEEVRGLEHAIDHTRARSATINASYNQEFANHLGDRAKTMSVQEMQNAAENFISSRTHTVVTRDDMTRAHIEKLYAQSKADERFGGIRAIQTWQENFRTMYDMRRTRGVTHQDVEHQRYKSEAELAKGNSKMMTAEGGVQLDQIKAYQTFAHDSKKHAEDNMGVTQEGVAKDLTKTHEGKRNGN